MSEKPYEKIMLHLSFQTAMVVSEIAMMIAHKWGRDLTVEHMKATQDELMDLMVNFKEETDGPPRKRS